MEITLESLGLSKEEIQNRVIDQIVRSALTSAVWNEDGDEIAIRSKFSHTIEDACRARIDQKINELGEQHVLPNVDRYVETLTLQETNRWGEKKGSSVTFVEYMVERAEAYITEPVNFEGKTKAEAGGYSWSKSQSRISHMIHQHLHYSIETAIKAMLKDANANIVAGLEAALKAKLEELQKAIKIAVTVK
jgi:hypothetical protein